MRTQLWIADLRVAGRNALRRPGFTALVVLTLALGIGVTSAVFALLDGVLLRPLPYRDPARLVFVWQTLPEHGVFELEATPFDYRAWHDVKSFAALALVATDAFTLTGDDNPERVRGARMTASLLPLLGVAPRFGRAFDAAEDDDAAAPVAILSDGLWRRRFGADPNVIGRIVRVNGTDHTVIGVMPPFVALPGPLAANSDLWLPARMTTSERFNEISHNYTIVARLAEAATFASASAEIGTFAQRLATDRADTHRNVGARLVTFDDQTVRGIKPTLLVIAGGVALLLLLACANAATLLVARAANRQRESAVRAALGAGTVQLLSLAIAESVVYVALGSGTGLLLGRWTLHALMPVIVVGPSSAGPIELTSRSLLFTTTIAVAVALAFGMLLAAHRPRLLSTALKASGRTMVGSSSAARTRGVLVVAQITFAVMLLATAGLLVNSFVKLSRVGPGFDPAHVISFRLSLTDNGYQAPSHRIAFVNALMQNLGTTPGINGAAITSMIPFGGARGANGVEIEGRPRQPGATIIIDQRQVTPAYFRVMRIPMVKGRSLQPSDDEQAERVVVINKAMADLYWPAGNPIEHRVRVTAGNNEGVWFRIVGVVANVRHIALSREPVPEMYYAYAQAPAGTFAVVARTDSDPAASAPVARQAVRALDPTLPMYDIRSMEERIAASFAQTRGTMLLLAVTAVLATTLAAIAIYGSIWYSVSQRLPEIGIRLALGATRGSVCANVMGRALLLAASGTALGVGGVLAVRPFLSALLFQTPPTDVITYTAVVTLLLALTLGAAIGPAARAMRVDPVIALRDE